MAYGDTGLTNLVLTGSLTVGTDFTIEGSGLTTVTKTITFDEMTDVTTTGTYEFPADIPAGAYFVCTKILAVVGFAGDTSAVITIGDGTDVDRYMTGTPSVFTTAAAGVDAGVPSGKPFHLLDKTPTVIVTTDSDFSSVTAGSVTIAITYLA